MLLMGKSRREFIKAAAASTAGVLLPGCASFDRWMLGEGRDDGQMVTIVGAGLAGLSAALTLKKNQIPFRLFEGSQRVGGRVYTLSDLNISSTHAELGGERIDIEQQAILELIRELKISFDEVETKESYGYFEKSGWPGKDWAKSLQSLQKIFLEISREAYSGTVQVLNSLNRSQFPRAEVLDRMSVDELVSRLHSSLTTQQKNFLLQLARTEWGAEPQEISSLQLIHFMRDQFRPLRKKFVRINGGNSVLTQALLDRVYGIIPDRFVRFHHRLMEIKPDENGWRLTFKNKDSYQDTIAHRIILALPPTQIRGITGWQHLPLTIAQKELIENIGIGGHGKVILGFNGLPWAQHPRFSPAVQWISEEAPIQFSEAGSASAKGIGAIHGIIQAQVGGSFGEQVGLHSVGESLKVFEKLLGRSSDFENISAVHNWRKYPWSQGSRSFLKPGQFQKKEAWNFSETKKQKFPVILAGDHMSLTWQGTMNGAVSTGVESALFFVSK